MSSVRTLLSDGPIAINLGLEAFASALQDQDVQVIHVNWTPRPTLDDETQALLDKLL